MYKKRVHDPSRGPQSPFTNYYYYYLMPIRASMEKDNFGFLWITSWCASTDNVVADWHCSPANSIEAAGERALELIE